ncbi:hypothetical protein, partial [Bacteroides intestinalis]
SRLFNGLINRSLNSIGIPIGQALVNYGAAEFGGVALGKIFGWGAKGLVSLLGKSGAKAATQGISAGTNVVYEGRDALGIVRYVGITERDPIVRFAEHLNSGTARATLKYSVVSGAQNLTRIQARVWEQTLINTYGLGKNGGLLFNSINSISPKYWSQYGIK